jgi:hypothetical protein
MMSDACVLWSRYDSLDQEHPRCANHCLCIAGMSLPSAACQMKQLKLTDERNIYDRSSAITIMSGMLLPVCDYIVSEAKYVPVTASLVGLFCIVTRHI